MYKAELSQELIKLLKSALVPLVLLVLIFLLIFGKDIFHSKNHRNHKNDSPSEKFIYALQTQYSNLTIHKTDSPEDRDIKLFLKYANFSLQYSVQSRDLIRKRISFKSISPKYFMCEISGDTPGAGIYINQDLYFFTYVSNELQKVDFKNYHWRVMDSKFANDLSERPLLKVLYDGLPDTNTIVETNTWDYIDVLSQPTILLSWNYNAFVTHAGSYFDTVEYKFVKSDSAYNCIDSIVAFPHDPAIIRRQYIYVDNHYQTKDLIFSANQMFRYLNDHNSNSELNTEHMIQHFIRDNGRDKFMNIIKIGALKNLYQYSNASPEDIGAW